MNVCAKFDGNQSKRYLSGLTVATCTSDLYLISAVRSDNMCVSSLLTYRLSLSFISVGNNKHGGQQQQEVSHLLDSFYLS